MTDTYSGTIIGSLSGNVWRVWADYWTREEGQIPPLHYYRDGAGSDAFFVSAVSTSQLDGFLKAQASSPDLRLRAFSDWVLSPSRWFGWWSVFSAEARTHAARPADK